MEAFRLQQEPVQPTPLESLIFQLLECTFSIYSWIVCELGPFDETKDDSLLESDQDRSNPLQGEWVIGGRVVGLH